MFGPCQMNEATKAMERLAAFFLRGKKFSAGRAQACHLMTDASMSVEDSYIIIARMKSHHSVLFNTNFDNRF